RQTLFFTATMPAEIRRITEAFLHNPVKVEVSKPATAAITVTQSQVPSRSEPHEKREVLRRLLRDAKDLKNAIIFCNRKREVAVLYKSLQKHGFSVGALHGDMDQPARMAALDQFRKGELPLLVASDVAARGLDIPEVSHVFNFDVPHHPDDYVHRIGRTGRAGRSGTAISIVTPMDHKSVAAIEKLIGQSIPRAEVDLVRDAGASEDAHEPRSRESSRRGRKNGREAGRDREPPHGGPRHHGTPTQQPQRASQTQRSEPRRQREADAEPADHSHLPAFLLRPVRARV
ncbi:MAG: DEAD/DEAH box helicase, partial [Candidatus Eremiobacteraeota bacterium]|nr:DEAD/DEAH box helicase [Candidatus Eremiobacteraeota bacterium]